MPPNTSLGPLPQVCSPEPSPEDAQEWQWGDRGEATQCPPPAVPTSGQWSYRCRAEAGLVCSLCGHRGSVVWCRRGLPGNRHRHPAEPLLPGMEPQVPILTLCRLLRCFFSGQQEATVSFMEHWEPHVLGWGTCIHWSWGRTLDPWPSAVLSG